MPPPVSRPLTIAHRIAQARIGAATITDLRKVWHLLDPHDLDGSFDRWLAAVVPIIQTRRTDSADLAAQYLEAMKKLELGSQARVTPIVATDAPLTALTTSMLVTGPVAVRKASMLLTPISQAMRVAEAATSAAAMRHVLDGGRETITATIGQDDQIAGWQRITGGKPCDFCSMLSENVYREASVDFRSHDGCNCVPEPVFT